MIQVIPKPAGGATKPPIMRSMSYNPAENAILINTDEEGGTYKFYQLPSGNPATLTSRGEVPESFAGQGATAVFIARNRFAVWNRFTSTIQVPLRCDHVARQVLGRSDLVLHNIAVAHEARRRRA